MAALSVAFHQERWVKAVLEGCGHGVLWLAEGRSPKPPAQEAEHLHFTHGRYQAGSAPPAQRNLRKPVPDGPTNEDTRWAVD